MKTFDVFVYEVASEMMISATVKVESKEPGICCEVEETIDLLSDTVNADSNHSKHYWCVFERLPSRSFAKNCALAGEYFENRIGGTNNG